MTQIISMLVAVGFIFFAGFNGLRLISPKRPVSNIVEESALAFGLGTGLISLEMLVIFLIGDSFSAPLIIAPWLAVFLLNILRSKRRASGRAVVGLLAAGTALEAAYAFFRALIKPVESYDAIAIYAIKSKIFYLARTIPPDFFTRMAAIFPHPDYPLNVPLAETFMYLFLGNLNSELAKIIFPLFFYGLLVLLYFAVKRMLNNTAAFLAVFLVASTPQVNAYAANGYLDLVLAFYVFAAFASLIEWFKDTRRREAFFLSALMAGLAGWTKNEGMMYAAICVIIIAAFLSFASRQRPSARAGHLILYCGIICAMLAPWVWLKHLHHIVNSDLNFGGLAGSLGKKLWEGTWPIFYEFQKEFFNLKKWNILWPLISVVIIFNLKQAFSGLRRYTAAFLFLAVTGYVLAYLSSLTDISYLVSKTWSRFLLHFLPVAVYWAFASLPEKEIPR